MFQEFSAKSSPANGPVRLAALRREIGRAGLDGFIVPRADVFQGEYVAESDARLGWLTGFTGSAGFCIALADRAGVFIDGRYRVQVRAEVDLTAFTPVPWPEVKPGPWLREQMPQGGQVGFDPWLHTRREIEELAKALAGSGITLAESRNLVNAIWTDRPAPPRAPARIHPAEFAGEDSAAKRRRLGAALATGGARTAVLTLPDSIAWLLNIRGADIPRNPVVQAFALLDATGSLALFADPGKFDAALLAHLGAEVRLAPFDAFSEALTDLSGPVQVDPATAPLAVWRLLEAAGIPAVAGEDPCIAAKARKNPAEVAGMEAAHLRDAAALAEFLAWVDAEAPQGALTEIDVVTRLEECRRATGVLRDISFDTICGAGPNGAIVHYRVTEGTNRAVTPGELLLVDSGAQYPDGTTDITRTLAVGPVPEEARGPFTRVLRGMIALARARWPRGLAGRDLDALARAPLWQAGLDYDHGTGHGVGAALCVHEGPARISRISDVALAPGMILSDEPGYYREGAFGIRIENLLLIEEAPKLGDGRDQLCFRTLTWVPIDRRLIVAGMLSDEERAWLDGYHAEVLARVAPLVSAPTRAWLEAACAPL
ncbi:aminopeptidase P family protein [Sinirhodobacter huangdaonensis]|uniref:Aminopeptidase P family protein n=1 Tax=Paenirhodobacter huangdaonensis TaxID=2501515 RepID=A0A3S4MF25_9RHOB|nr:aminopeptidase P family protein [Sinirhodobacter huangdaonensis]RWR49982.1 aminopeptidase P family protein [Sinirhodobacter huangdaonensis]